MKKDNILNAVIISADEIKKTFPNYSPEKVEDLHPKSAKLADKEFYRYLEESAYQEVFLLNGGTASGKTELILTHLSQEKAIIFDSTMPTVEGVRIKIKASKEHKKKVTVYSVIPDDLKRAFVAFLNRDRKFSDSHFYRTHSESRKTLLWVAENYNDVDINLIESYYGFNEKLQFRKLIFKKRTQLVDYLSVIQLSESDIIEKINKSL